MSDEQFSYAAQAAPDLSMALGSFSPYGTAPEQKPLFGSNLAAMLFGGLGGLKIPGMPAVPAPATTPGRPTLGGLGFGTGIGAALLLGAGALLVGPLLYGLLGRKDDMKPKDMVALMAANLLAGPEYQKRLLAASDAETADKVIKSAVTFAERILDVTAEFETEEVQKRRAEVEKKLREASEELEDVKRDLADALKSKVDATKGKLGEALDTLTGKKAPPTVTGGQGGATSGTGPVTIQPPPAPPTP